MQSNEQNENMFEIKITEDDEVNNAPDAETSDSDQKEKQVTDQNQVSEKATPSDAERNNYREQLQRLQAEFANYKKRIEREKLELSVFLKSELVIALLPIIDDFERMIDHSDHDDNEFLKGTTLIYQKLMDILKTQGLKPIDAVGQKFDPSFHEAIITESTYDKEDETVVEEWRKGYLFHDRLLRPAQVKVLKNEKMAEN